MVMATLKKITVTAVAFFILIICSSHKKQTIKKGTVKITFINTVKNNPLILDSVEYTNPFGEQYHVSKLKYYISNVKLNNTKQDFIEQESYHLIDAADTASLSFTLDVPLNTYNSISFMIGVDSIKNVSGAQSGALDPANGMFWTWNSGYVFFKLEGTSPASTIINNKIEYHIGGFAGANNALKVVTLPLPADKILKIKQDRSCEIFIETDLDKLWQHPNDLKIAARPATMTPGIIAKKIAANYCTMFTIKAVNN
jgi:hypothetical protein